MQISNVYTNFSKTISQLQNFEVLEQNLRFSTNLKYNTNLKFYMKNRNFNS